MFHRFTRFHRHHLVWQQWSGVSVDILSWISLEKEFIKYSIAYFCWMFFLHIFCFISRLIKGCRCANCHSNCKFFFSLHLFSIPFTTNPIIMTCYKNDHKKKWRKKIEQKERSSCWNGRRIVSVTGCLIYQHFNFQSIQFHLIFSFLLNGPHLAIWNGNSSQFNHRLKDIIDSM